MNISNKLHLASYLVKRAIFDDIRNAYNAYQTYKDFKGKYDNLSGTIQQGLGQFNSMLGQGGLSQLGNTIQQGLGQFNSMLGQGGLSQLGNTIQQGISGVMQGLNTNPMQPIQNVKPRVWPGSKAQPLPNSSPNIGGPSRQSTQNTPNTFLENLSRGVLPKPSGPSSARILPNRPGDSGGEMRKLPRRPGDKPGTTYLF